MPSFQRKRNNVRFYFNFRKEPIPNTPQPIPVTRAVHTTTTPQPFAYSLPQIRTQPPSMLPATLENVFGVPVTLPPVSYGNRNRAPPGQKQVLCSNGEYITVPDTGAPMACCGKSVYDTSQQVCLGDQYTIHKSLVPGLPGFFVNVLNTSLPTGTVEPPQTEPTTTTEKAPVPTQGSQSIIDNNVMTMEIACNGNVYQVPYARLDKVACCGEYLFDSRYYRCLNGAVVAITSPGVTVEVDMTSEENSVSSMPFIQPFAPTQAPQAQPRSFDRVAVTFNVPNPDKSVTPVPQGMPGPQFPMSHGFPLPGQDMGGFFNIPRLEPTYPPVTPAMNTPRSGSDVDTGIPFVPFWNPTSMKQQDNFSQAETYGPQLSMWNQFPSIQLPAPVSQAPPQIQPQATPSYGYQQYMPNRMPMGELSQNYPDYPTFQEPEGESPRLPTPIGAFIQQRAPTVNRPEMMMPPPSGGNWPDPSAFANRPIPGHYGGQPTNSFPQDSSSDSMAWRPRPIPSNQPDHHVIDQQQHHPAGFMLTPVVPVETVPVDFGSHYRQVNMTPQGSQNAQNYILPILNQGPPAMRPIVGQSYSQSAITDAQCNNGRLVRAPSHDQDFIYCCGNNPYDIRSQFCCGGAIEEWLGSENGKVYQLCCDGVYIYNVNGDPDVQCCGRTAINTKYEPCNRF